MKSAVVSSFPNFEAALQELEGIVQSLEGGSTSLEDSLKTYERGVILLKLCQDTLSQAEQKIRMLDNDRLQDFNPAQSYVPDSQN